MPVSDPPPSSQFAPPSAPPPGVRHLLAFAGGRGGAGTSILSTNVAVYLAQLGRSVLLVDANPAGPSLHTMLDVPPDQRMREPGELEDELEAVETTVPGLRLLRQEYSVGSTVPLRPGRKPRWAQKLRQQDVDYVLLDLGCSTSPATLDLFLSADLGVVVSMPDPPSIEGVYRFTRALFQRRLRRSLLKDRFRMRLLERAQATLAPLPAPEELVRTLARFDTGLAETAANELSRIRPRLVVNGARARSDTDLGYAMRDMSAHYLGVELDYAGHIERDDTVWLSVVRRRPLLIDSPASKSARNIERIARRALALVARKAVTDPKVSTPILPKDPTLYDVLLTHRGAADDELRRAYKRQRDIYKAGSLPITSLVKDDELPRAQALIDEAYDTLLDPLRRRAYDISMFPETSDEQVPNNPERDAAMEAERALLREELSQELTAQTTFTGELLRKVRQSQGIELNDIAQRTKISLSYLSAIEEEHFAELPAFVYLRGFVGEIAKYLKLDVMQVSRTYLKRYREWRAEQEQSRER